MKILHHKINSQHGFTLLEMMMTILLIGLTATVVVMTLPSNTNKASSPIWQADRFIVLLQLAEDQALMSGNEFGIVFDDNTYQFAIYNYIKKKWLPIGTGGLDKKIKLPDNLRLEKILNGSVWGKVQKVEEEPFIKDHEQVKIEVKEKTVSLKPQVFVMSSGELTPFRLVFSNVETGKSSFISVDMNGDISHKKDQ
ncbi:MAG: type II secretion system minor pseudopilin GspH [Psychromonas sp.]|nr:type II secretion system minor pseudopilin GspH [Psychromonas sp.]